MLLSPSFATVWPSNSQADLKNRSFALPIVRTDYSNTPMTALQQITDEMRQQNLLNNYSYGSYLIWQGIRPSIDS
jgi:hypothetical protein